MTRCLGAQRLAALALALLSFAATDSDSALELVAVSPQFALPHGGGAAPVPSHMLEFSGRLVLHGPLTEAGSGAVNDGPVAWTGTEFSMSGLPESVSDPHVVVHDGSLVFGSSVWDGTTLSPLAGSEAFSVVAVDAAVSTPSGLLAIADIVPGSTDLNRRDLIRWDGISWSSIATLNVGGRTIVEFDGKIFLGNNFSMYPPTSAPASLVSFDGAWASYTGLPSILRLSTITGNLLALTFDGLYEWSGTDFVLIAGTETGEFHDIVAFDGVWAVCGSFPDSFDGAAATNVASWDGSSFTALPRIGAEKPGFYPDVVTKLAVFGGDLYAAGGFEQGTQPEPARGVARLVGGQWVGLDTQIGYGLTSEVLALGVHDGEAYVGTEAAGQYDATFTLEPNGWREISSLIRDRTNDFAWTSQGVIAAGFRFLTGSRAVVERRVGDEWLVLGKSTSFPPSSWANAVIEYGGEVVVGGFFPDLDGVVLENIAAHDGVAWHALGPGIDGIVHDMIEFEGDLVVTGDFFTIGTETIQNVARWDGSAWASMGGGFSSFGRCLAIVDGVLYVGGSIQYSAAGYVPQLARWDGVDWVGVPNPPNAVVEDLVAIDGSLFLAGNFSQAGGVSADGFAQFDHRTQTWPTPDFLPDAPVHSLAIDGSDLYLGGEFTSLQGPSGAVPANHVARVTFDLTVDAPPVDRPRATRFVEVFPNPANPHVTFRYTAASAGAVEIVVYDSRGRRVRAWSMEATASGVGTLMWDGLDALGESVGSGVFFARLRGSDGDQDLRKVVLVK